jgi:hypothetical protein
MGHRLELTGSLGERASRSSFDGKPPFSESEYSAVNYRPC